MRLLATIFALCLGAVAAFGQDESNSRILSYIEEKLSTDSRKITLRGIDGLLASRAKIDEITISDTTGVWLRIEDASIVWTRSALLRGRVEIDELKAARITITRPPVDDRRLPTPEASEPFRLPEMPVSVNIGALDVARLELGEALMGQSAVMAITGSTSLASGVVQANLETTRLDGPGGSFKLIAGYAQDTGAVDMFLRLSEPPNGLAVNAMGLPGLPALDMGIEGAGQIDDLALDLFMRTGDQQNVSGKIVLAGRADGGLGFDANLEGQIDGLVGESARPFFAGKSQIIAKGAQLVDGGYELNAFNVQTASMELGGTAAINQAGSIERIVTRGRIGSQGTQTQLPVPGGEVSVRAVDLVVDYGNRDDGGWTASINTRGLDIGELDIGFTDISLEGETVRADDGSTQSVTTRATGVMGGFEADDPGIVRALGDRINLNVGTLWQAEQPFQINIAKLTGNGIDLDVAGQVSSFIFDGRIGAKVARLSPFSGLLNRRLAGSADLSLAGRISPFTGTFDITTSGTSTNLRLGVPGLDPLLVGLTNLEGRLTRDQGGLRTKGFSLSNPQISLTSDGEIASENADFGFDAVLSDLSLVRPEVEGQLSLSGRAKGSDGDIGLSALLKVEDGKLLDQPLNEFRANFDGRMAEDALTGNLRASGQLSDTPIQLFTLLGASPDEQSLENLRLMVGPSQVTGRLVAKTDQAEYEGELDIDARDISALAALFLQDAKGEVLANVKLTPTARFGQQIAMTANVNEFAFTGNGAAPLRLEKARMEAVVYDALRIPGLIGSLNFTNLEGFGVRATTGEATATFDGDKTNFELDSALDIGTRFAASGALSQTELGGRVDLEKFNIYQGDTVMGLRTPGSVEFEGGHLTSVDMELSAGSGVLTAKGAVTEAYDLAITARDLPLAAINAVRPDLRATGAISGDVQITGARDAPRVKFDLGGRELGSAALRSAEVPGFDVTLKGEMIDGLTTLSTEFSGPDNLTSNLNGTYRADTQALDMNGKLDRFPLVLIDPLAGRIGLRGALNGVFTLGGTVPDPQANFNLSGSGLSFDLMAQNAVAPFDAIVAGNFAGQQIDLSSSRFTSNSGANFQIDGQIPLFEDGLNVFLGGKLPLSLLNVPLAASGVRGTGIVNLSLRTTGSLSAPRSAGSLAVDDASFVVPRANLRLDGLTARGDIAGDRLRITSLSAKNSRGGTIGAKASVLLDVPQGMPGEIEITARDFSYTDGRIATADFDADLKLTGPLAQRPLLAGQVNVKTVEVTIPGAQAAGPKSFALNLQHKNPTPQISQTLKRASTTPGQKSTSGGGSDIELDVVLRAPSRVFVRGRGLDGEVGGEIRVGGTLSKPVPVGQLDLIRGRIQVLSQRIDMNSGGVVFDGELIPEMTLRARVVTDDLEATVALEGLVTKPKISFSSVPDLPDDEILARVAFGRPLSELSPLQIAQVASVGAEFAGRSELSFLNQMRQATGLDDLDFETTDDGATMVRAGKYLQDNIYSSIEADNAGNSKAIINLDISSKVKARGSVDNLGNTSLGIFFERDY